ncbi:protein RRNAD1-like [Anopheles albimanus]|uniref:Methyltranfer_dom domain-containing protein n=1 Tax=Anopheles albimanus TaxID=7167 RepID=A0A182FI22_ANOAL|nr:protein RRNAD1-like [Anopheles albimanus]
MENQFLGDPFDYRAYFVRATQFLQKYRWIFCFNNTQFIRKGALDALPKDWINDLHSAAPEEFRDLPLGYISSSWSSSFREFLLDRNQLLVEFERHEGAGAPRNVPKGIGIKKAYEIDCFESFIGLRSLHRSSVFIEYGSGLGYLSQHLHERHGQKVLGVEGNPQRVETSLGRQSELYPSSKEAVRYVDHLITEESIAYLQEAVAKHFPDDPAPTTAIVGLHACADLSVTALRHFLHCPSVQELIIAPCCYHKMKMQPDGQTFVNVPLSEELAAAMDLVKGDFICRPFLRLASQQTAARWKTMTVEDHQHHGRVMFRRGLVDAILNEGESVKVAKTKRIPTETTKDGLLEQFILQKDSNGPLEVAEWTDAHRHKLEILLSRYPDGDRLSEYIECLQTCLQSICESLIILDRMCYLESMCTRNGLRLRRKLVRLRNEGLTPRCFIFYAAKLSTAGDEIKAS